VLHNTDAEKGTEIGKNVLLHILRGGDNPIYVRSANTNKAEFNEIFKTNKSQIFIFEKSTQRRDFIAEVFAAVEAYNTSLKLTSVSVHIEDCLDSHGHPLLANTSIDEHFDTYYINGQAETQDGLFIAKCFVTTPIPAGKYGNHIWTTKNATWLIRTAEGERPDPVKRRPFLTKYYSLRGNSPEKIVLEDKGIQISFNNTRSFEIVVDRLKDRGLSSLDKFIIHHYIIYRCIDLFITDKLPASSIINFLGRYQIFGAKRVLYENLFICACWERLILGQGDDRRTGDRKAANMRLGLFYQAGFSTVQDIFYCQINERPVEDSDRISAEVRSVDEPARIFLMEYERSYISAIAPFTFLQPFKLIYFQPKKDAVSSNSSRVEHILLEEYVFLAQP